MCRATLLPDPDRPRRRMMRTGGDVSASSGVAASTERLKTCDRRRRGQKTAPARVPGAIRLKRWNIAGGALRFTRVMIAFLFFVLLDAAVELVGEDVDGRVHVCFGSLRVDRV